jgi:hypothetical protein
MHCQPFGWPASAGCLLVGDPLQGLYYRGNLVTLLAKVRKNLLNIHIACLSLSKY